MKLHILINYTVQHQKKNFKKQRVDFGKFRGDEREYEINFFLSRQIFSAFCILIWKHRPEFSLLDL